MFLLQKSTKFYNTTGSKSGDVCGKRGRSFLLCSVGSWSNLCDKLEKLAHVVFLIKSVNI